MATNNGGPAFPIVPTNGNQVEVMSLRDYFAAKAMAAMVANPTTVFTKDIDKCNRIVCEMAYAIADAMLAARGNQ